MRLKPWVKWALADIALAIVFLCSFYTVKSTDRGVLSTFGKISDEVVEPGLHFKLPFIQGINKMSVQTQKISQEETVYTKDIQSAVVNLEVNYELNPNSVATIYRQVGKQYEERIMQPIIRGVVKDVFGDYNAAAVVENRDQVRQLIEQGISSQLPEGYFTNVRVQISNIDYDDNFEKAIVEKQVAEQKALTAKNNTARIREESEQTIIQANAEAEAIRIKAAAMERNPRVIEYEAVTKWNGQLPTYMLGSSVPFINLGK